MIESDLIESLLKVPSQEFIVYKCLLGQEMQVLLKWLTNELVAQLLEERILCRLTLQEGEHTPRNSYNREVLVILTVVLRRPLQDAVHLSQVLLVSETLLCVSWNIDS